MRRNGNDRRSEAGARLEMRGRQRVKTVPFARVRQAANGACVGAPEPRRTQMSWHISWHILAHYSRPSGLLDCPAARA